MMPMEYKLQLGNLQMFFPQQIAMCNRGLLKFAITYTDLLRELIATR